MDISLRDYQEDMIGGTRRALKSVRRVLLQAPTGAGKTVLASFMISQTAARGDSAWFICHRAELVEGTSKTFTKFGIRHGIIAAGITGNLREPVQICSIDTLKGRLATLKTPRIAIIDEAHHSGAAGWMKVIQWLTDNGALIIGLSATPERLDGRGLDDLFDDLVPGPQPGWLIDNGHLAPYRVFAPHIPDMKGVRKQMGDFSKKDNAERMDRPKLTGDIIAHWRRYAEGVRTVAFAVNVAHSQHLAESFTLAGIPAAHLDGGTPKAERKRIIEAYADGSIQVLTNVDLFGEGFDLSSIAQRDVTIDAVIQARPTQSLSLHLQQVGRALRPAPGKIAIILDHAGNAMSHGLPDDDREWSLDGKQSRKKAANDNAPPPPMICNSVALHRRKGEGCFNAIRVPLPTHCPHCGSELEGRGTAKPVEVGDGELRELTDADKAQLRAKRNIEQAEAKTLGELVALGQRRGYKSPMTWAQKVFAGRGRK